MSQEIMTKKVKFIKDGECVAVVDCAVGEKVAVPEIPSEKKDYRLMWLGSDKVVEEDTECVAYYTLGNPEQLLAALSHPLIAYEEGKTDNICNVFPASMAILYMASEVRHNPDHAIFRDRVVEHLKHFVNPENNAAPYFDVTCNWPYTPLTACITVCHETPEIWNCLTEREKEMYDFIMECFAYCQALGTNDPNDYCTGPGLCGNFGKFWNPNYRLANTPPMVFAARYFGGAKAVDDMLLAFDYDKTVARFEEYGFQRAKKVWTRPVAVIDGVPTRTQKDFMENGGEAFINTTNERLHYVPGCSGGTGAGVRHKYTWCGFNLDQYDEIIRDLFQYNYKGGPCLSSYGEFPDGKPKAYIADGTKTPVEGMDGMMTEMKSGDGGDGIHGADIRSSTAYCSHDFLLVVSMLMAFKELDMYHLEAPENEDVYKLAWVGNTDFIYKNVHGYMSYSLGKQHEVAYENGHNGYYIAKAWWNEHYGDMPQCLED